MRRVFIVSDRVRRFDRNDQTIYKFSSQQICTYFDFVTVRVTCICFVINFFLLKDCFSSLFYYPRMRITLFLGLTLSAFSASHRHMNKLPFVRVD